MHLGFFFSFFYSHLAAILMSVAAPSVVSFFCIVFDIVPSGGIKKKEKWVNEWMNERENNKIHVESSAAFNGMFALSIECWSFI